MACYTKEDCVWSEWQQVWLPNEVAASIYDGDYVHEDIRDDEFTWCADTETIIIVMMFGCVKYPKSGSIIPTNKYHHGVTW